MAKGDREVLHPGASPAGQWNQDQRATNADKGAAREGSLTQGPIRETSPVGNVFQLPSGRQAAFALKVNGSIVEGAADTEVVNTNGASTFSAQATIRNLVFVDNGKNDGVELARVGVLGRVLFQNCVFRRTTGGHGVFVESGGHAAFTGCRFEGIIAPGGKCVYNAGPALNAYAIGCADVTGAGFNNTTLVGVV